jgi:hypothetical protein
MLRDLAQRLVNMPASTDGWDEKLVRACRKQAVLHHLEFGSDRVVDATLELALKMGVWRDAIGALGGAMPSFLEARLSELQEARYALAEALGMTEDDEPQPVRYAAPCRMGGAHQRYPGKNFPNSCVRCGMYVESWPQQSTNQEVSLP